VTGHGDGLHALGTFQHTTSIFLGLRSTEKHLLVPPIVSFYCPCSNPHNPSPEAHTTEAQQGGNGKRERYWMREHNSNLSQPFRRHRHLPVSNNKQASIPPDPRLHPPNTREEESIDRIGNPFPSPRWPRTPGRRIRGFSASPSCSVLRVGFVFAFCLGAASCVGRSKAESPPIFTLHSLATLQAETAHRSALDPREERQRQTKK
jgi:hypothetical protein